MKAYERLTARAATTGDRRVALQALLANPLMPDYPVAQHLLEALLWANRFYLGRFFPPDSGSAATP
jgi:6-phospho-beta-glucosidase